MFIRQRGISLSLERQVYIPAVKAEDGNAVLTPARHTTKYLGSIKSYVSPDAIPADLTAKLTEVELAELKAHLQKNVPPPIDWLARLPDWLARAAQDIVVKADALRADRRDPRTSDLVDQLKVIGEGWQALRVAAQTAGVLRAPVARKAKPAPAPVVKAKPAVKVVKKATPKAKVVAKPAVKAAPARKAKPGASPKAAKATAKKPAPRVRAVVKAPVAVVKRAAKPAAKKVALKARPTVKKASAQKAAAPRKAAAPAKTVAKTGAKRAVRSAAKVPAKAAAKRKT